MTSRSDCNAVRLGNNPVPTIYFSHTVERKKVRIDTGKNTTLKYSENKDESKQKQKNTPGSGNSVQELPIIKTPSDIYRAFVDIENGEYVPRKSILKSCSRVDSGSSDGSKSNALDSDDRRAGQKGISCEGASCSKTSGSIMEEEQQKPPKKPLSLPESSEIVSGNVVKKSFFSSSRTPHTSVARSMRSTTPEQKETRSERSEGTAKKFLKFKVVRFHLKK